MWQGPGAVYCISRVVWQSARPRGWLGLWGAGGRCSLGLEAGRRGNQGAGEPYAPAYSLADRTCYRENDPNPAPNAYTLPGTLGPGLPIKPSAPCYSMASKMDMRRNTEMLARVPGPASFVVPEPNVYLHRQPAYSMWRKYKFIRDSTPGPADYKTSHVTIIKPRAPDFSLGIRHSEYLAPLVIDVME
uniref:Uncharacterized protein n=1 Tax=Chelonoidis abingdonii TaxID=106734 RepID=A0A8C0IYU3_CHEAB